MASLGKQWEELWVALRAAFACFPLFIALVCLWWVRRILRADVVHLGVGSHNKFFNGYLKIEGGPCDGL